MSTTLNKTEYQKYAKQIILENIGINGQKKLKQAKILIIGLGGLGCPALIYLANTGIGNISIMDNDMVALSNLNRQILYNVNDVNNNKIDCAHSILQKINKKCNIAIYNEKLNYKNAYKIIKLYDIVIDATDNFITRYIIDETCYKLHKVHIYGAIHKYEGHVSSFNYKNNLRYIDLYPKTLHLEELKCEDNGILGVMSGVIGILQATEAIKIILGIDTILSGYILTYNLLTTSFNKINFRPRKTEYIKMYDERKLNFFNHSIHIEELNQMEHEQFIIIDIRNQIEFHLDYNYKSINIPVRFFQAKKTIQFIKYRLKKYKIILSCNTLTTSSSISNLLKYYNIKTYLLKYQK